MDYLKGGLGRGSQEEGQEGLARINRLPPAIEQKNALNPGREGKTAEDGYQVL